MQSSIRSHSLVAVSYNWRDYENSLTRSQLLGTPVVFCCSKLWISYALNLPSCTYLISSNEGTMPVTSFAQTSSSCHPTQRKHSAVVDCYQETVTVMWQWQTGFPRKPFMIELWQSKDLNVQRLVAPWSIHDLRVGTPGCCCPWDLDVYMSLYLKEWAGLSPVALASWGKARKILVLCSGGRRLGCQQHFAFGIPQGTWELNALRCR